MKIKGPGESSLLLLNVIKLLDKYQIPYAIVGAFAASFYGVVRASLDADAVIFIEGNEKLNQLLASLKKIALKIELRQGDSSDPIRWVINIQDKFQNRVDLLIGIQGMRKNAYESVITVSFMKQLVKIISVEELVAMKIYAGSAKDIQDVVNILKISAERINLPLLKRLTRQYGKKELEKLEKILIKKANQ